MLRVEVRFQIETLYCAGLKHMLNIELSTAKTLDSNYGITVSKNNCPTTNTRCCTFQRAMGTETALSELSAVSRTTSSTPPLPSTSHLKNMHFLCSTLYNRDYCHA